MKETALREEKSRIMAESCKYKSRRKRHEEKGKQYKFLEKKIVRG